MGHHDEECHWLFILTLETRLLELNPRYVIVKLECNPFLCRKLKFDWRNNIPAGYTVWRVNKDLLDNAQVEFSDEARDD